MADSANNAASRPDEDARMTRSRPTVERIDPSRPREFAGSGREVDYFLPIAFEPDQEDRWVIRHRLTSEVYLSPIDTGARARTRDIAYVGRITTGRQRLLIIAGVHSLGSVGAVHYIQHNLHDLYRQAGLKDFSMVVASQHKGTHVIESSALCPPTLH